MEPESYYLTNQNHKYHTKTSNMNTQNINFCQQSFKLCVTLSFQNELQLRETPVKNCQIITPLYFKYQLRHHFTKLQLVIYFQL